MIPAENRHPARRRADGQPVRDLAPIAAPPAIPDLAATLEAVDRALSAARRWRRPLSLAAIEATASAQAPALVAGLEVVLRRTDVIWRDRADGAMVLLTDTDASGANRALARVADSVAVARRAGIATAAPGIAAPDLVALARDRMAPRGPRTEGER